VALEERLDVLRWDEANIRVPGSAEDLAEVVVLQAHERTNSTIDAVGPETFRYRDMVEVKQDSRLNERRRSCLRKRCSESA
jgi:hypothetical protein